MGTPGRCRRGAVSFMLAPLPWRCRLWQRHPPSERPLPRESRPRLPCWRALLRSDHSQSHLHMWAHCCQMHVLPSTCRACTCCAASLFLLCHRLPSCILQSNLYMLTPCNQKYVHPSTCGLAHAALPISACNLTSSPCILHMTLLFSCTTKDTHTALTGSGLLEQLLHIYQRGGMTHRR